MARMDRKPDLTLNDLADHHGITIHRVSVWRFLRGLGLTLHNDPQAPLQPDLDPVEMACAKLKALIRRAAARTFEDLWRAVGHVCEAAGYETNWPQ